ncbi:hypothetical protein NUW58_g2995 [Xylaria curta]|uniref:Uncharacterized protein n=1 Tax=Xylaria curta TaxID=42375 RepID=A0ACC1PDJ3_9PEZI|nr:hypothetical protein NUW58_g2995 [Xylaria curta]
MEGADYVTTLYVVSWVLTGLVIVITITRIIGRTLFMKQAGWDDLFMIIGSLSALACSALVTVAVSHGLGRHQGEIKDPDDLSEAIKYTILAPNLSIVSSTCGKISVLIFLVRLVGLSAKRWHLYFLWGLCAILIAFNIVAIVFIIRFCDPPQKQWQPWLPGTCLNPEIQRNVGFVQSAYNALVDVIVAIFPALFIMRLKMTLRTKIGLSVLMGGGIFAAGATIVKIYLLKDLDKHSDITWYWAPITLWYTAEMDVIIIVGSFPILWTLARILRQKKANIPDHGIYDIVTGDSSCQHGSESYQLAGSATRALQEVDNMRTEGTWNGEHVQRCH